MCTANYPLRLIDGWMDLILRSHTGRQTDKGYCPDSFHDMYFMFLHVIFFALSANIFFQTGKKYGRGNILYHFQSNDGCYEGGDEEQTPECGRLMEKENADEDGAYCTDTCPDGISCANRQCLCGLGQ
jgi:hypothetical protein